MLREVISSGQPKKLAGIEIKQEVEVADRKQGHGGYPPKEYRVEAQRQFV